MNPKQTTTKTCLANAIGRQCRQFTTYRSDKIKRRRDESDFAKINYDKPFVLSLCIFTCS